MSPFFDPASGRGRVAQGPVSGHWRGGTAGGIAIYSPQSCRGAWWGQRSHAWHTGEGGSCQGTREGVRRGILTMLTGSFHCAVIHKGRTGDRPALTCQPHSPSFALASRTLKGNCYR